MNEYSERCAALAAAINITFELLEPTSLDNKTSRPKLAAQLLGVMMEMNTTTNSGKVRTSLDHAEFEDLKVIIETIVHRFEVIIGEISFKTQPANKVDRGLVILDAYVSNDTIKILKKNMVKTKDVK